MLSYLFLALLLVHSSLSIKWKDCGSKTGKLVNVVIPGCETVDRCPLKHRTNQSVSITFSPSVQVTDLKAKVYGQLGPVSVPFPLPNPNACQNSNLTCPLVVGQQYVYTAAIYVDPSYPSIQVAVKWELLDQTGATTICFQVPVQIVNPSLATWLDDKRRRNRIFMNGAYYYQSQMPLVNIHDINA